MASESCCIPTENSVLLALQGFLWRGGIRIGHAKTICICIPPSKLPRNTTQHQTLIGHSTQVSWNLMETPVLVLGRGCADSIRIAPWRGLVSGSVSCCCFSARTAAYSARLCEDICTTEEWEDEGRIHANAKRQHLNPSNDGVEFF